MTGTVVRTRPDRGFGFIRKDASVEEFFFHSNECDGSVDVGDHVEFDAESTPRGGHAVRVRRTDAPPPQGMGGTVRVLRFDYGYIDDWRKQTSYFFHRNGCLSDFSTLQVGDKVQFEPVTTPKGPRAENVTLE